MKTPGILAWWRNRPTGPASIPPPFHAARPTMTAAEQVAAILAVDPRRDFHLERRRRPAGT